MGSIDQPSKKAITELEIIFDDTFSSSKFNKELVNYFKNNLDTLNRSGVKFMWRIATKEERPLYKERGIKHYPAAIIPQKSTKYGVKDIIKEISIYVNKRKQMSNTSTSLSDGFSSVSEEALHEFQLKAIGKPGDDDSDPRDGFDSHYRRKQSEMMRRRTAAGMESPDSDTPGQGSGRQDNDLNLTIGKGNDPYSVRLPSSGRPDNLHPMRIDPSDSLQRLRSQGGADTQDLDLMQAQLDKLDSSLGSSGMDYY